MKRILCLFKGHMPVSKKRKKEIDHALMMYGCDAWGSDAFSNMEIMKVLRKEKDSCERCGLTLR